MEELEIKLKKEETKRGGKLSSKEKELKYLDELYRINGVDQYGLPLDKSYLTS